MLIRGPFSCGLALRRFLACFLLIITPLLVLPACASSTSKAPKEQPVKPGGDLSRTGPSGAVSVSYIFRSSTSGEAIALSARWSALAEQDQGLGGSLREQLRQAGLIGAIINTDAAEALLAQLSQPPKPGSLQWTTLASTIQVPMPAGPRWLNLHTGQGSPTPWSLLLAGGPTPLPPGQVRLLARAWPAPGDATDQGFFTSTLMLDLSPLLQTEARNQEPPLGTAIKLPTQPSERGMALLSQRVTTTLKPGQVLILAPILTRLEPVTPQPEPPLKPGQVVRTDAQPPPPAAPAGIGAGLGPKAQTPLSLGEALLSNAQPAEPARQAAVLVLTPKLPGGFSLGR